MLYEKTYGVRELRKEGLRECGTGLLSVDLRFSAILLRLRVQPVVHQNSDFNWARASGPEIRATAPLSISALRRSTYAAQAT